MIQSLLMEFSDIKVLFKMTSSNTLLCIKKETAK